MKPPTISFLFGKSLTRWWFQLIYIFSPTWGDDQSDQFFQMGWNHQLQSIFLKKDALHICIILKCPPRPGNSETCETQRVFMFRSGISPKETFICNLHHWFSIPRDFINDTISLELSSLPVISRFHSHFKDILLHKYIIIYTYTPSRSLFWLVKALFWGLPTQTSRSNLDPIWVFP